MGFLGGLAGTLGKILETQGEEQRKESALTRAEERAALRQFNAQDNIQMIDGVPHYVLVGQKGVIASRPVPQHILDKQQADSITSKNIIQSQGLYQKAVENGYTGDKTQWDLDNKNESEAKHLRVTEGIKNEFSLASFKAQQSILHANQKEITRLTASLSGSDKTPEEKRKIEAEIRKIQAEAAWMESILSKNPGAAPTVGTYPGYNLTPSGAAPYVPTSTTKVE